MDIDQIKAALSAARLKHARSVALSSSVVKGFLVIGCAAIAGIAQFATWGAAPNPMQVVGIAATLGVLLGGIYVLSIEQDAADATEVAAKALDAALEAEAELNDMDEFYDAFDRLLATYNMCLTMRGALEQATIDASNVDSFIQRMFDLVSPAVAIASGTKPADRPTLGIYKALPSMENGKFELKCIAQERAIKCHIDEARIWPEGVGIAGVAFTNAREIVVPDLRAEGMRAIFGPKDLSREYDADRYVSMVSVPIMVHGRAKPWGVVNATSSRSHHFAAASGPGFKSDEPVRTLAAFVALAVSFADAVERSRGSTLANRP